MRQSQLRSSNKRKSNFRRNAAITCAIAAAPMVEALASLRDIAVVGTLIVGGGSMFLLGTALRSRRLQSAGVVLTLAGMLEASSMNADDQTMLSNLSSRPMDQITMVLDPELRALEAHNRTYVDPATAPPNESFGTTYDLYSINDNY